jgi:chemotaxis protein CheC
MERTVNEHQLSTLRHVCQAGMEHAAATLSRLMGEAVFPGATRIFPAEQAELPQFISNGEAMVTGISFLMHGTVQGSLLMVIPLESAGVILKKLLLRTDPPAPPLTELERSAIMEVGNIFASACVDKLGESLRMTLVPSTPFLSIAPYGEIIQHFLKDSGAAGMPGRISETDICSEDERFALQCLFFPAPSSLDLVFTALEAAVS